MRSVLYFTGRLQAFAGASLYLNMFGMVVISFLEGIGIIMLIPLVGMSGIAGVRTGSTPLSGLFSPLRELPEAWRLPAALTAFFLVLAGQNLLKRSVMLRNADIHQKFVHQLTLETYRALLQANWLFFIKRRKSDFINTLTSELSRVSSGIGYFLQLVTSVAFMMIQVGIAFWLSVPMTVFVLVCGALIAWLMRNSVRKAKRLGNQSMELSKTYLAGLTDQLNGIKDIKINSLESSRLAWLRDISARRRREGNEFMKLKTSSQLYYQIGFAAMVASFVFISVQLFHARMEQLLLIILIFSRLWPRFTGFQAGLEQIAGNLSAFQNVLSLQRDCKEAEEILIGSGGVAQEKSMVLEQGLECRGVYFRYHRSDPVYALHNIHLRIPAGRMTAVVGRSGAGKSTLIDILMGLIQPETGEVWADGEPLTDGNRQAFRQSVSYVPQDPFLFHATVRDNLLLVKPDATDGELWQALEFSASDAFVRKLPQGLDSMVGDRGMRLSGGERQRLVLARSILRQPSILVLDEATSALDSENEAKIQEAVERLKGRMTLIVIAHRLSTIRNADQVIVIDEGRVVQEGGFQQLAQDECSLFGQLLGKQQEALAQVAAEGREIGLHPRGQPPVIGV